MKKTKIIYWTITVVFALFMLSTAIPDILKVQDAIKFMSHLGYPLYFIPFIGVAKALGAMAILVPNFKKIKEWAYAGIFFDLIGATYSNMMVDGLQLGLLFMLVPFALGISSYIYNQKLTNSIG